MNKELLLFIPGLGAKEHDEYAVKLATGLADYCSQNGIDHNVNDEAHIDGSVARKIELKSLGKILEIREVFWSDLAPKLSSESIFTKVVRGFSLFLYWGLSFGVWKVIKNSKYMLSSMIFAILVILCWYCGATITALTAIAENPNFVGVPLPDSVTELLRFFFSSSR